MKIILNENQIDKLILEYMSSNWLEGTYDFSSEELGSWRVNISIRYKKITFTNIDSERSQVFSDNRAMNIIKQITNIWNDLDLSVEDAIKLWISRHSRRKKS